MGVFGVVFLAIKLMKIPKKVISVIGRWSV